MRLIVALFTARSAKPVAGAMGGKVGAMRVAQMGQSRRASNTERGTGGGAQSGVGEHGTVVSEAEETRIERGIPERGENQTVVHIEPLRRRISAQGTMWEARSSSGSVMPVIGQRPP